MTGQPQWQWLSAYRHKRESMRVFSDDGLKAVRDGLRSPWDRDLGRVINSTYFRRLQRKTQVFGVTESDFFRTRITHSLEASQIGQVLANYYGVPPVLVATACLAHDIGHPPFGHTGEKILNYLAMQTSDGQIGFEGNAQTFRILTFLDRSYKETPGFGLDLCSATLDATLKYKRPFDSTEAKSKLKGNGDTAYKCYYREDESMVKGVIEKTGTGIKRSPLVMFVEAADDIAYATHDIEDGIRAGFLTDKRIAHTVELLIDNKDAIGPRWKLRLEMMRKECLQKSLSNPLPLSQNSFKRWKRGLVDAFVVEIASAKSEIQQKLFELNYSDKLKENLLISQVEGVGVVLEGFKKMVEEAIITNIQVQHAQACAKVMLEEYFSVFKPVIEKPSAHRNALTLGSLPKMVQEQLKKAENKNTRLRIFLDYVSGMTDEYLTRRYRMLKGIDTPTAFTVPA